MAEMSRKEFLMGVVALEVGELSDFAQAELDKDVARASKNKAKAKEEYAPLIEVANALLDEVGLVTASDLALKADITTQKATRVFKYMEDTVSVKPIQNDKGRYVNGYFREVKEGE